ncbi:hypothetical protein ASD65_00175 [Microbacterium sp. Root61]|uniref:DUF1684 domain-containing protein n=1 Tax=Microbacterium sp. Root61 TaxID=1736570 RepID=UPI0006F69D21|nr:DUF1684 domain-containing protein [Microbacterium sp. Root61]KRA23010.1 hypothetical protein ASD65_00175 [Microbacterium sp. Root61]
MPVKEHLEGQWREWRHARVAELSRPYGWTSLVAQYWLHEGEEPKALEDLPGQWQVIDGQVTFLPPVEGPTLSVDGEHPSAPVAIVPGRNQTYGHGKSVPVYFGDREIETIVRTNDADERIFAVRVRDPKVSAAKDFSNLESYEYDLAWRLPATFTPTAALDVEQATVETGVRETTTRIGTLRVELGGKPYDLVVIGKETATGIQPVVHLRDQTSGRTTYGAGRVVELGLPGEAPESIESIDLNYLTPLPCAFTNFVTCPIPPRENSVEIEILAGERKPVESIERVLTYNG